MQIYVLKNSTYFLNKYLRQTDFPYVLLNILPDYLFARTAKKIVCIILFASYHISWIYPTR